MNYKENVSRKISEISKMILKLNISVYGHGMGPVDMTVSKGHISWEVCVVGVGGGLRV